MPIPTPIQFVPALPENPLTGTSPEKTAVTGNSNSGVGVLGQCVGGPGAAITPPADGVLGVGKNGVHGRSSSATDSGVWGENTESGSGVTGTSPGGFGIFGQSKQSDGVNGISSDAGHSGVMGRNGSGYGVWGASDTNYGVCATSNSGIALWAQSGGVGGTAGHFEGNVVVTGDLQLDNADIAENFLVADCSVDVGMVLCIDDDERLRPCCREYDSRVIGVISGAGPLRPGIILHRSATELGRVPVALTGRVYCMVDATLVPIGTGDLLTTSTTTGHAMRAEPSRATGAVIGKALKPLSHGRGLIPILVTLQ